jgi:hypothetical protein
MGMGAHGLSFSLQLNAARSPSSINSPRVVFVFMHGLPTHHVSSCYGLPAGRRKTTSARYTHPCSSHFTYRRRKKHPPSNGIPSFRHVHKPMKSNTLCGLQMACGAAPIYLSFAQTKLNTVFIECKAAPGHESPSYVTNYSGTERSA